MIFDFGRFVVSYALETKLMNVKLDPKDENDLEALARESGKDPGELISELLHEAILQLKENGAHPSTDAIAVQSCYELALKAGIIGMVDDLPAEYRTNPKTWEGFGRG